MSAATYSATGRTTGLAPTRFDDHVGFAEANSDIRGSVGRSRRRVAPRMASTPPKDSCGCRSVSRVLVEAAHVKGVDRRGAARRTDDDPQRALDHDVVPGTVGNSLARLVGTRPRWATKVSPPL